MQTLFWDIPGGPNPTPNGVWDTTTANWSPNVGGGAQTTWLNGNNAVFSATGLDATGNYTVTLAASVSVGDLTYTGGNLGSTLQLAAGGANTITTANAQMNVTVDFGTTLIVAPSIVGAGNLVLQGGILVLTGANTYSGGTTISAGTLQLGNGSTSGSIVGNVVNSDTFNIVDANTAGITTITNNFGTTNFMNTSTAGTATITNNGGFTQFFDTATAGNAAVITNFSGFTEFFDTSTAGNATITVNSGGETDFNNLSTDGAATIINNNNGFTNFTNTSTAGRAVITNNGGFTQFLDQSNNALPVLTGRPCCHMPVGTGEFVW